MNTLLTTQQAATKLGLGKACLERDRISNKNIPFIRICNRTIRYVEEDLDNYINNLRGVNASKTYTNAKSRCIFN